MLLTQILQKIRSAFYTKAETDSKLSTKANNSDVVHKSGNETISGIKNFNNVVLGEQDGVIRIGNNGEGTYFCTLNYDGRIYNISKQFVPTTNNEYNLGTPSNKWKDVYATTFHGNLVGNVTGNCSGSAGSVAWANVSGKPTNVSQFTNDSGYINEDNLKYRDGKMYLSSRNTNGTWSVNIPKEWTKSMLVIIHQGTGYCDIKRTDANINTSWYRLGCTVSSNVFMSSIENYDSDHVVTIECTSMDDEWLYMYVLKFIRGVYRG